MATKLNLLADFPAISTQAWKDKIIADPERLPDETGRAASA